VIVSDLESMTSAAVTTTITVEDETEEDRASVIMTGAGVEIETQIRTVTGETTPEIVIESGARVLLTLVPEAGVATAAIVPREPPIAQSPKHQT